MRGNNGNNGGTILDKFYMPQNAPISAGSIQPKQVPWEFGINQKIQSKFLRTSAINIKHFVTTSNSASSTLSNFLPGNTASFFTKLTANIPHQTDLNFAMPFTMIFQGLNGSALVDHQIYPSLGNAISGTAYQTQSGLDYLNSGVDTNPINPDFSFYNINVYNNTGGTQTLYFFSIWKYLIYNNVSQA